MAATQKLMESVEKHAVGTPGIEKNEEQDLEEEDSGDEGPLDLVGTSTSSKKKKKKKTKKKASDQSEIPNAK